MYSDPARQEVFDKLRDHDCRAFAKQLTWSVFVEAAERAGLRLWSCPLNLANLVWLGIAAAWRKSDSFVTILTVTLQLLQDQEQFAKSEFGQDLANKERRSQCQKSRAKKRRKPISKHRPHGQSPKQVTEEAFAKARQRMPLSFWLHLIGVLLERFEAEHAERMRFRGFRLLAMDGTRLTLPDEKALRNFYGTASNGKGKHNAQARMVLLQSPLTRLPLAYQLEPVKVGEVTMARRLASGLRPDDLVLLDSGYKSYGLLWDIQRRGAFFCLRLQGSMNLARFPVVVRASTNAGASDAQRFPRSMAPPKVCPFDRPALVEYQVPGHRRIRLLTNVLDQERLSYDDFSRLTTTPGAAEKLLPGL